MIWFRYVRALVFLYVVCIVSSLHAISHHLVLNPDAIERNDHDIDEVFVRPLRIDTIARESDVCMQDDEFYYLIAMRVGDNASADIIKQAVRYLFKKNKFSDIVLVVDVHDGRCSLNFSFFSFWTFDRLRIHGMMTGKHAYSQYYTIDPGEPFDEIKHANAINKIKQALNNEGCFNAQVNSTCEYKNNTKDVTVDVVIAKGARFAVRVVDVKIAINSGMSAVILSDIKREKYAKQLKRLIGSGYDKKAIEHQTAVLKNKLLGDGFVHVTVQLHEKIDRKNECVDLAFVLSLHQKRQFVFAGNRFFSTIQLRDRLLQFGRSAALLPPSLLAEEIVYAYHDKGFWDVKVKPQEQEGCYFFVINEGNRSRISHIVIQNAQHALSSVLVKRCFREIRRHTYFDSDALQRSLAALQAWYVQEGFSEVKVVGHTFTRHEQTDRYSLAIALDEGVRTYVVAVQIPDFPVLEKQGPFACVGKGKQVPFNPTVINEQRRWLIQHFHKQGFVHVKVTSEVCKHADHTITLVWHVHNVEKKVRFGKTVIQGSSTFPFAYIREALQYRQGDIWQQDKVKQSFVQLKDFEIFDAIHMVPDYGSDDDKVMRIGLHNDDPFELRVRTGFELEHVRKYNTLAGVSYKFGGTFLVKNPLKVGDLIRVSTDVTRSHKEIIAQYYRPILMPYLMRLLFQAYTTKHDHPGFIGSKRDIYTISHHGVLCTVHKKNAYIDCGLSAGIELMQTRIKDDHVETYRLAQQLARAINFEPTLLGKNIPYFFVQPTLFMDYLDNKLNPKRGSLTVMSLKGMIPLDKKYHSSYLVRLLIEQSFFVPVGPVVGAFRLRFGHIFYHKLSTIAPTERFYLGGAHSLRGYNADLAPPLGIFTDAFGVGHVVPRGGKSMLNINTEVRVPLVKIVGIVFFTDAGLLIGDQLGSITTNNMLAASGFGLRCNTPIGPLRFDIGWKWFKQRPSDSSYAWFLSFGHAF